MEYRFPHHYKSMHSARSLTTGVYFLGNLGADRHVKFMAEAGMCGTSRCTGSGLEE